MFFNRNAMKKLKMQNKKLSEKKLNQTRSAGIHIALNKVIIFVGKLGCFYNFVLKLNPLSAVRVHLCFYVVDLFNPCPAEPGYTLFLKQCRSRSVGF